MYFRPFVCVKEKMLHICFNLDEKYVMPCKVLMRQIDDVTSDRVTYHLIGIRKRDMGTKNECKFYPDPDLSCFLPENLTAYYYFSAAAMYRLLIPFLIPVDRAIYIDVDTVVLKDIKLLWDKKIDYVGAVSDPCATHHKNRLKTEAPSYFNSGLILFDSKKIRENMPDYKERILQAQKDYVLDLKDQDIFNIVFKDHITELGYEWNIDVHNLIESEDSEQTICEKSKAFKNPSLVHCMGKDKWWNCEGLKFGDYWDKYAGTDIPKDRKTCLKVNNFLIVRN